MRKFLKILLVNIFLLCQDSYAQESGGLDKVMEENKDKPINIKSESLNINNLQNVALFTDNVVVTQGNMIMNSDEMKVFSDFDKNTKKNKFKRIEAKGNVKLSTEGKEARSNIAIYDIVAGRIEMYENVFLKEYGNTLQGSKFIYDINTGKTSIFADKNANEKKVTPDQEIAEDNKEGVKEGGVLDKAFDGISVPKSTDSGRVKVDFTPGEDIKKFDVPKPPIKIKSSTEQRQRLD